MSQVIKLMRYIFDIYCHTFILQNEIKEATATTTGAATEKERKRERWDSAFTNSHPSIQFHLQWQQLFIARPVPAYFFHHHRFNSLPLSLHSVQKRGKESRHINIYFILHPRTTKSLSLSRSPCMKAHIHSCNVLKGMTFHFIIYFLFTLLWIHKHMHVHIQILTWE